MKNKTSKKAQTANGIKQYVRRSYLEEVFPICLDGKEYRINLAGMNKLSPTGENWGYAPLQKTYKTLEEAESIRKELWKTIVRWVNNYA